MSIAVTRVAGKSMRPTMALPPRTVVFWRMRSTVGLATGDTDSPTWLFHVPTTDNSGNVDTSANSHVDVNGDGFDDVIVGAYQADPGAWIIRDNPSLTGSYRRFDFEQWLQYRLGSERLL